MTITKSLLIGAVVVALSVGAVGVSTSLAAEDGQRPGGLSGLVDAIAEKFNLDADEVQAVFDEYHQTQMEEKRAQQQARFEERLARAVEEGELTQDQVDAILEKMEELRSYMEEYKDLDPEERKSAMQGHMDDLREWAEENDIPPQYLHIGPPPQQGGQGGPGMGMNNGMGNGMGQPRFQPQEQAQ